MKCSELQIEDWVMIKSSLSPIKVMAVHQKKVGYHIYQHRLDWIRQDLLEPIPLTDKILENNFNKVKDAFQIDGLWKIWSNSNYGYIVATLVIDDFGAGSYEPCIPCRYVHELQNLIRLLHINKKITL